MKLWNKKRKVCIYLCNFLCVGVLFTHATNNNNIVIIICNSYSLIHHILVFHRRGIFMIDITLV